MLAPDLRARLRDVLDADPRPRLAAGDRLAAVLALLIEEDMTLVFTERAATLRRHAGEISFPGGLSEPFDASLAETALREAEEEIGLDRRTPEVVGALSEVHTFVSGILVVPFVAIVPIRPDLRPNDGEIARVLPLRVRRLQETERPVTWSRPGGRRWTGWVYDVDGATIWGATGFMLHELLGRLREAG